MVSLIIVLTFFWMIVILYPASVLILSIIAHLQKKIGHKGADEAAERLRCIRIDARKDHLKDALFKVLVAVVFFILSPSLVLYFFMQSNGF